MISRSPSSKQWLLTLPSLAWLGVFFVIPAILIVITAFRPADLHGGVGAGWTMANIEALRDPAWLPIAWRTLALSAATTFICLALALPMTLHIARVGPRLRQFLLLLVVIPFFILTLAALIFGKWHPVGALWACLLFGFLDAVAIRLQGVMLPPALGGGEVPVQAIQALPYVLTVVLLAGFIGSALAPRALGVPYVKER